MSIVLRQMNENDTETGYQLSQQVKWPHRREDWLQAYRLGEGLVATEAGKTVGCALIWHWGGSHTLGLVIVDPLCQGRGIGKLLMEGLLEKAPEGMVRLHATEMGKGLYEKYGFRQQSPMHQHQSASLPPFPAAEPAPGQRLRAATADDLPRLIDYDYSAHGLRRAALYEDLAGSAEFITVLETGDEITGFAVVRRFGRGYVVGPLLARDEAAARTLFCDCAARLQDEFVRIDTQGEWPFSVWLKAQGMPVVDAPVMMVRGTPWQKRPEAFLDFGLFSQALG